MRAHAAPTRRSALLGLAAVLLPRAAAAAAEPSGSAEPSGCRSVTHEEVGYVVCRYDLRAYDLRLFWADEAGQPYASLPNLLRAPAGHGLAMAMNAGMYQVDLRPVGLFVEGGRELARLNTADGTGNFHLKPNGVFFVGADGRAGILETAAYARRKPRVRLAAQSGPMLVIDGQIHPKFSEEGPSRKRRNGVGVVDGQSVVFAISDDPVSFGSFARLFRDDLGCRDALFLDGSISALHAPELGRTDISLKPLGPLIGVVRRS